MRKLIINAEDFGLAPSVNQAVIDCFRKGNLTSATLMANMPAAAQAAKLVKDNPGLAVGLHFCITEWRPLSRCPSLINKDGFFYTRRQLLIRILTGRVNAGDIQGELEAQINRAESLGIKLTHIDSHQHIHMSPWVFNRIAPIVSARGLPMRLVYPPIDAGIALKRPLKFFKQLALYHNSRRYRHRLKTKSNDCLVSIHDLGSTEGLDSSIYMALLESARGRETIEIMVHPYILGDDIAALYGKSLDQRMPFLKKCALEYRLLSGRSLFSDQQKFQLVNYAGV